MNTLWMNNDRKLLRQKDKYQIRCIFEVFVLGFFLSMIGQHSLINEVAIFNGKISVTLVLNSSNRIWRFIWSSEQHIIIPFSGFWQLCDTKSPFLGIEGIDVSIWRHWPLDFDCPSYSTENETTRRDARIYWLSWHLAKWI